MLRARLIRPRAWLRRGLSSDAVRAHTVHVFVPGRVAHTVRTLLEHAQSGDTAAAAWATHAEVAARANEQLGRLSALEAAAPRPSRDLATLSALYAGVVSDLEVVLAHELFATCIIYVRGMREEDRCIDVSPPLHHNFRLTPPLLAGA